MRKLIAAAILFGLLGPFAAAQSVTSSSVGTRYCCGPSGLRPYLYLPRSRVVSMSNGEAGFFPEFTLSGSMEPYTLILLGIPMPATPVSSFLPGFQTDCFLEVWPVIVYPLAQPLPIGLGVMYSQIPPGVVFRFQNINFLDYRFSNYVEFVWP